MNMSYCRFQNTLRDLQDCANNINDDIEDLSDEEKNAREDLIQLCIQIAENTDPNDSLK